MNSFRAAGLFALGTAFALGGSGCAPTATPPAPPATAAREAEPRAFELDSVHPVTHITIEPSPTASGPQVLIMPGPGLPLTELAKVERLPDVPEDERTAPLPPLIDSPFQDPPSYIPAAIPVPAPKPAEPKPVEKPKPAGNSVLTGPRPAEAQPKAAEKPVEKPAEKPAAKPEAAPELPPVEKKDDGTRSVPATTRITPNRGALLAGVGRQVQQLTEHATALAQRGAFFASRAEFLKALQISAQALDGIDGTNEHAKALTCGLRAIKEAGDFAKLGPADVEADLASIVGGHRTPILKNVKLDDLTTTTALQRYLTYSQQQLSAAVQGVPEASLALYGLGRLEPLMNDRAEEQSLSSLNGPRSMTWHQAALLVDARNYRAANEMAVWLARYGQHQDARRLLVHSLQVKRVPEAWHNLAVVHDHLGERDLASMARKELDMARSQPQGAGRPMVEWMDAEQFAKRSTPGATR